MKYLMLGLIAMVITGCASSSSKLDAKCMKIYAKSEAGIEQCLLD